MKPFGVVDKSNTVKNKIAKLQKEQRLVQNEINSSTVELDKFRKKKDEELARIEQEIENKKQEFDSLIASKTNELSTLEISKKQRIASMAKLAKEQKEITADIQELREKLKNDISIVEETMQKATTAFKDASDIRLKAQEVLTKAINEANCVEDVKSTAQIDLSVLDKIIASAEVLSSQLQTLTGRLRDEIKDREIAVETKARWFAVKEDELNSREAHLITEKKKLKAAFDLMQKYDKK